MGAFVIAAIGRDFAAAVAGRRRARNLLRTAGRVLAGDPSHWGGQLSHAGIALIAVAIMASTGLSQRAELTIPPAGGASFSQYSLSYESPIVVLDEGYRLVEGIQISVRDAGGRTVTLEPRFHRYPGYRLPVATPDLLRTLRGDLYLSLAGISRQGIVLDAFFFPLVWLLWTGGIVTAAGGLWSLLARGRDRVRSPRRPESAVHG
jgi:cytochrome c-type biogenesis protein CcmF